MRSYGVSVLVSNKKHIESCPICSSPDQKEIIDRVLILSNEEQAPYRLKIVRCGYCQHVYQNYVWNEEQLKQYYFSGPAYYRPDYSHNIPSTSLIRFDSVMEDIKPFLIQDCLHLDVGGYAGHFSYYLSNHVKESHCLDVSSYLPTGSSKNVKIIKDSLFEYACKSDEQYDFISLNHTLEHLTDLQSVKNALSKLLKPNGYLLIEVPDNLEMTESILDYTLDHTQYFTGHSLFEFLDDKFYIRTFRHFKYNKTVDVGKGFMYRVLAQQKVEQLAYSPQKKQKYVERIIEKIENRINNNSRIYVWGSGYHTRLLFSLSKVIHQKTCYLIDSDPTREGRIAFGKKIVHPSKLTYQKDVPLLISSFAYKQEIGDLARSFFSAESIINPYEI